MRSAYHRWSTALAVGLLLAGCTKTRESEPQPKPEAKAQVQAPAPAPKPAAPAPAPPAFPVSDATLSYLEDLPGEKCRWVQHTPPDEPKTFLTLPNPCSDWKLNWKADGREALVFQHGTSPVRMKGAEAYEQALASHRDWRKRQALRVDLATGKSTSLSLPSRGLFRLMGFDPQGRVVAFTEETYVEGFNAPPPALKLVEGQLLFEGQRYELPEDPGGTPGLAHAFRLEKNGKWTRFETKGASFFSYDAEGYGALDTHRAMIDTLWTPPRVMGQADLGDVAEDSADFAALSAVLAPSDKGGWKQLETTEGPLYLYLWVHSGDEGEEPPRYKGLVRTRGEEGLVEPEGLTFDGEFTVDMRGGWVLLSGVDTYKQVLWNAKTKKPVASLNKSPRDVIFWPKPSDPLSASAPLPAPQPVEASVRSLPAAQQLATAFRAVHGSARQATFQWEEDTYTLTPAGLEWMGDTAVLLTLAKNSSECKTCNGAMGIHYLEPEGAGFVVRGTWPLLVEGSSFGAPTLEWKIRRDLGRNPFLTSKGHFTGQGAECVWLELAELMPDRPLRRGTFFIGHESVNMFEGDKLTKWEGKIDQPVPDSSFDVVYTGTDTFTEHYQLKDGEYRRVGESRFKGVCW